jgi:hypothetical protein
MLMNIRPCFRGLAAILAFSLSAAEGDKLPKPIDPATIAAWKKTGADVGWFAPGRSYRWHFRIGESGKEGEVPAFCVWSWQPKLLATLPAPEVPFGLDLSTTEITDKDLAELARFKDLAALDLSFTPVEGKGCKDLAGLENLRVISFRSAQIVFAGLKGIGTLKQIESLDLAGTRLNDRGVRELKPLTRLTTLDLTGTRATGANLNDFGELRHLKLNLTEVTDEALAGLAEGLPHLESLELAETRITDEGIRSLAKAKKLRFLNVTEAKVSAAAVKELQKKLPDLQVKGPTE